MTPSRPQPKAALVLGLRGPLARIELLASRLARFAPSPAEREIAEGISAAVAELDGMVGALLGLVAPPAAAADPVGPVGPVLDEVVARVAPALEARGMAWERDRAGDGACAGLTLTRRVAIELLDRVSRDLAPGAVLRFGARQHAGGTTLWVAVGPARADGTPEPAPPVAPAWPEGLARLGEEPGPLYAVSLPGGGRGCTAS